MCVHMHICICVYVLRKWYAVSGVKTGRSHIHIDIPKMQMEPGTYHQEVNECSGQRVSGNPGSTPD